MYGMGGKFRKSGVAGEEGGFMLNKIESGPTERERRRRSGTGPPVPAPGVVPSVPGVGGDKMTLQVPQASNV